MNLRKRALPPSNAQPCARSWLPARLAGRPPLIAKGQSAVRLSRRRSRRRSLWMRKGAWCRGLPRKSFTPTPGFMRPESHRTVLGTSPTCLSAPIACLTYGNDTDFTLHLRSSLLALCMYELHLCVSVFVLLSRPVSDRSTSSVHILKLRWSLFFIGSTKPHTLLLLA